MTVTDLGTITCVNVESPRVSAVCKACSRELSFDSHTYSQETGVISPLYPWGTEQDWYKLSCHVTWAPSAFPPAWSRGLDGFQNSTWHEVRNRLYWRKRSHRSQGSAKDENHIIPRRALPGPGQRTEHHLGLPEEALSCHGSPFLGQLDYNIVSGQIIKFLGCLAAWAQVPRFIEVI